MDFDIAVVIPAFNESLLIEKTLDRYSKEADNRILFVVVDNLSRDDTVSKIRKWKRAHPFVSLVLLFEKERGAVYARKKGMQYAKRRARVIVSTDADNWPLQSFYKHIQKGFLSEDAEILRGRVRYERSVRLQWHIFIPKLLDLISWQESVEEQFFGPFFFGGYFGVKSNNVNDLAFPTKNIPIPEESTIFWSRHCYYLGYRFTLSEFDMLSSSRRFWSDPYGSIRGERTKPLRTEVRSNVTREKILRALRNNQNKLIRLRQRYFARRVLMFLLDAVYFEREVQHGNIVGSVVEAVCERFGMDRNKLRRYAHFPLKRSIVEIDEAYQNSVLAQLEKDYQEKRLRRASLPR